MHTRAGTLAKVDRGKPSCVDYGGYGLHTRLHSVTVAQGSFKPLGPGSNPGGGIKLPKRDTELGLTYQVGK
jgi:hypothetical protein